VLRERLLVPLDEVAIADHDPDLVRHSAVRNWRGRQPRWADPISTPLFSGPRPIADPAEFMTPSSSACCCTLNPRSARPPDGGERRAWPQCESESTRIARWRMQPGELRAAGDVYGAVAVLDRCA
jgi:hypothetical protein